MDLAGSVTIGTVLIAAGAGICAWTLTPGAGRTAINSSEWYWRTISRWVNQDWFDRYADANVAWGRSSTVWGFRVFAALLASLGVWVLIAL